LVKIDGLAPPPMTDVPHLKKASSLTQQINKQFLATKKPLFQHEYFSSLFLSLLAVASSVQEG
jgi:hypothetical protein